MTKFSKPIAIIFTIFMVLFSSCSSDDNSFPQADLLIGKWREIDRSSGHPGYTWTFNSDGSFVWQVNNYAPEYGSWKLQNGVIVLFDDDEYYQIKLLDKTRLIVQDIEHENGSISEFIRVNDSE